MGPLPQMYKVLLVILTVALCLAGGVALARYLDLPLGGIGVGLAAGGLLAFLLTRDFGRTPSR
jgi:hypothetical protein